MDTYKKFFLIFFCVLFIASGLLLSTKTAKAGNALGLITPLFGIVVDPATGLVIDYLTCGVDLSWDDSACANPQRVNAACGDTSSPPPFELSNGQIMGYSEPWCSSGFRGQTVAQSGGVWDWFCMGVNGGADSSLCQYVPSPVNGACGDTTSASGIYSCDSGTLGAHAAQCCGIYDWYCVGSNGGSDSGLCRYIPPVNGVCGDTNSASGIYSCASGTLGIHTAQSCGIYDWYCSGENGGSSSDLCRYTPSSCSNGAIDPPCCTTFPCSDTSWSPDSSNYCSGESFTQTSNCGNTRSASGTQCCPNNCAADTCTGEWCNNGCNWVQGTKNCCAGNSGNTCYSEYNACGQRNSGTYNCAGACSVSTPPNSNCSYTVSATAGPNGNISPPSRTVSYGNTAEFTVTPSPGYSVASVSGCNGSLNGNKYTTGPITANCTVTATFIINTYPLTVTRAGSGTITSSPSGINCGSTCSASFNHGTQVTLTATPSAGYLFEGWNGAGCPSNGGLVCTINMNTSRSVTATFTVKTLNVSLAVAPTSGFRPLTSTLTATVSGTAQGTANYTFWWNCNNLTTSVAAAIAACGDPDGEGGNTNGAKFDNKNDNPKVVSHVYSTSGTFYPKVIVERDSGVPNATEVKTVTVLNRAPSAVNLSATQPNYCSSGPAATFSWSFSDPDTGDTQSAYQVQAATSPSFASLVFNSGKVASASNSSVTPPGVLAYNQNYYWRVMVWDSADLASTWATGSSFATPLHAYPTVNFKVVPASPSINEVAQVTDLSQVFGGAAKQSWAWSIPGATYLNGTSAASQNPQVKFASAGSRTATLTLTDSSGFSCQASKTMSVRLPLPGWKEVAP